MSTDEERRRIASNLRDLGMRLRDGFDRSQIPAALAIITGTIEKHVISWETILDKIADLIEPEQERTCRNVSNDEEWFTCSECGAHIYGGNYDHSFVDQSGARWYTTANKPGWNYCPNCGAEVVSE